MEVEVHQAEARFSELLRRVAAGDEVTITRSGVPVARLIAVESEKKNVGRPLGMDRGRVWVADDFDAPLPNEMLKAFYGGKIPKLERKRSKKK